MTDHAWMRHALGLMEKCPPTTSAFYVGAVIVAPNGEKLSEGYSRQRPHAHAEEAALEDLAPQDHHLLAGATLYSTLEPCTQRRSAPLTCTQLILRTPIARIVIAWREPVLFADCDGVEQLSAAGKTVIELPEFAAAAKQPNLHVLKDGE